MFSSKDISIQGCEITRDQISRKKVNFYRIYHTIEDVITQASAININCLSRLNKACRLSTIARSKAE